jgi:subtilisin family serine protease
MADDDYFVLELESDTVSDFRDDFEILGGSLSVESSLERMVSRSRKRLVAISAIKSATISEKMASEINREPNKFAVRDMEISLISPLSAAQDHQGVEAAAEPGHGPTWGVNEVLGFDPDEVSGAGVKVAVLDTGLVSFDAANPLPAFSGINDPIVENFTNEDGGDLNGHGTHCAGTIFGRPVKGTNIGIAPGVTQVYIAKVLNKYG